jgi:GNAT superfamily N-acetyltransferase
MANYSSMEIEITHFGPENPLYQQCLDIRLEVLRKPLGMEILPEDLQKDADSTHILCTVKGKPAGTVALLDNKLRQMAVLDEYQGRGLGAKLVRYLEEIAKAKGIGEIALDARFIAIPFYEKLGYECYTGIYDKIGIPHRDMKKKL